MNAKQTLIFLTILTILSACKEEPSQKPTVPPMKKKEVVYQVFTRLFGNTNTNNKPWGTIEENGVGKFADFTTEALTEIKDLGITHIWYTGVPHHAVIRDYTTYGISNDDPDVVKGRAGSPYAVKDYYNVNSDLAVDPSKRLEEFKALVQRTHNAGMKVIIDIVPNHVARNYEGLTNPEGVEDFGASDDTSKAYDKNNNFYYIPGEAFQVPEWQDGYLPLGGDAHRLADAKFEEVPAKWTGNGSRLARPHFNDWYETVKINYGVRPDGTKDFEELPEEYRQKDYKEHYEFWKDKALPDSWYKFKDITQYWLDLGVDGFRFDMAEMVPVEFWSYLNSNIKMKNPDAFLLAEVYNPQLYRDYIHKGKMDYLYDKVELYDSIKHIMKGYGWTDHIPVVQKGMADIEHHMLHFLENHDEQRIASPEFAGNAQLGKPAMVVSATISTSPTMIYFGQEVGEPGAEDAGFGKPSRTSIFDYIGVPHHQRWVNDKKFDGGQLSEEEKNLRDFYKRLLNFTIKSEALMGNYQEIHFFNKDHTEGYDHRILSYVRWSDSEKLIVLSNFDVEKSYSLNLKIPEDVIAQWQLTDGTYPLTEMLYQQTQPQLEVKNGQGQVQVQLEPLESFIFQLPCYYSNKCYAYGNVKGPTINQISKANCIFINQNEPKMKKTCIAALGAILLLTSCEMKKKPLVIGHRGAMGHETENTLASVQKALDLGVDMIEIDVFKISSGEVVVFHDERVDRLANAGGNIEEYNIADLRQLILDGGHKIPMLQEVLRLINNQVVLNIELKGDDTADKVNHIVNYYIEKEGWSPENFVISSFKWDELRTMREKNKDIQIAVLTEDDPIEAMQVAKELNAVAINPYFKQLTQENTAAMQAAGYKVYTWTVNEPADIQKMMEFGVDGIITNFPERVNCCSM